MTLLLLISADSQNAVIGTQWYCTLVAFRTSCMQAGSMRSKRPAMKSLCSALTAAGMVLSQDSTRGRQPNKWGSM